MEVGLQMYSVRQNFSKDPFGTLEKVAQSGYKYIEMANHRAETDPGTGFGISRDDLANKIADLGIKVIGAHVMPSDYAMFEDFYGDDRAIGKVVDFYSSIGANFISIPNDFFPSREHTLRRCERYNKVGRRCYEAGIRFLYHNHYHEFQKFDGEAVLDIIVNNTDERSVGIEFDAYWTLRGAVDPVSKIRQYGHRIAVIHEKDFPLNRIARLNAWQSLDPNVPVDWEGFHDTFSSDEFCEIGDGILKVQDVVDAGNEYGVPYILVEQDYTQMDEIDSIRRSMSNLRKLRGLVRG